MRSRNHSSFDDIAETALEEESAIFSKNERHKNNNANVDGPKSSNCNKLGHGAGRCYLRDKRDTRVSQLSARDGKREKNSELICYNCQGRGHMARHCRKPKRRIDKQVFSKEENGSNNRSGNEL